MRPLCFLALLAVGAAGCGTDLTAPNAAVGTYSVFMVDGQRIPIVTPLDSACITVNSGGWLTLTTGGTYSMVLDRINRVCNGIEDGGSASPQSGTYTQTRDTVITFHPAPPMGPAFAATFHPGTDRPGGGALPSLRFTFVGHDYWLINDAPVF